MTTVLILIFFNIFLCFISSLRLEGLCPHLFLHCPFTLISQSGRLTDTVPHSRPHSLPPIKSGLETWSGLQTRGAAAEQLSEDRDQCQHWGIYIQKKKLTWSEGAAFVCVCVCVCFLLLAFHHTCKTFPTLRHEQMHKACVYIHQSHTRWRSVFCFHFHPLKRKVCILCLLLMRSCNQLHDVLWAKNVNISQQAFQQLKSA